MDLERKYVTLNRLRGKALSQITLEEDLNVPDQKPDIFRIIHRQGEFRPDEIKGEAGKVKVRGIFLYRILYIGEGGDRMPEILEGSIPVDETVFLNELEEGDILDFHWEIEDLHVSAIHSRKANVKSVLALSAEAVKEQPVPLVNCPQEEQRLYVKTHPVRIQQEAVHKKDTLRVREEMNLPPGRPNIRRIIWKEMRLQGTQARPEEGKIQIKGELAVFFLYECEDEPGKIQWIEQGIPFRQELECAQCHADLNGKTEITLLRAELEMQPDYDGEPRMVRIDAVLELLARYFEEETREALCDAYSLSKEIAVRKKDYTWDYVCGVSDSCARVAGRMKLPETEPKMLQVLSSGIQVHLGHSEQKENGLLVQGTVELWMLYAAEDDAQPLACAAQSFPFEHTAQMSGLPPACSYQIFLCPDQLAVTMMDAGEAEMKASVQIQILFSQTEELELAEDLEESPLDMERVKRMPGMAIHVVQPEETLWDIAKSHITTCREVMELNDLKDDSLKAGQKLLLVKEIGSREKTG